MPITDQEALTRVIEHREIFHDEMLALMRRIMGGEMSPVMAAALLTGLRVKKETIGEITAAAQVMREFSVKVPLQAGPHLVDVVGTGGDGAHTFNISTCSMFVAAAAGAQIAKHGNRSVSSKTGSADVLEALGVQLALSPEAVAATRANLLKALEAQSHPGVQLRAERLAGAWPWLALRLSVRLHGQTRLLDLPLRADWDGQRLLAQGRLLLRQSDFGLQPFSVLGGALAVQDELVLDFSLSGRPASDCG